MVFKGETLAGEQPAIIDQDLFDAVQAKLNEKINNHRVSRTKSDALLLGHIYDDRGHKMTPSHVRKRGIKYRYYISSALLQGRAEQAGSVSRIPADEIEALVVKCVRGHLNGSTEIENTPSFTITSSGSRSNRTSWSSSLPIQKVPIPNESETVT